MKLHKSFLVAGVCVLATAAAACGIDVPVEKIVKKSPTVVVGKIERIEVAQPSDYAYDIAYIKVGKILKNGTTDIEVKEGKEIPLSMPSVNNKRLTSIDINYRKGTKGVWILQRQEKSVTFWATYPKDLQPLKEESNIAAIIAKQKS